MSASAIEVAGRLRASVVLAMVAAVSIGSALASCSEEGLGPPQQGSGTSTGNGGGFVVDEIVRDIKSRLSGPGQFLGQVLWALDAKVPVNHAEHQDHGLPEARRYGNVYGRWQSLQRKTSVWR